MENRLYCTGFKDLKQVFFRFLKENDALGDYIISCAHTSLLGINVLKTAPELWIDRAFLWRRSLKGESFWTSMHSKWYLEIRKFGKKS